MDEFNKSKVIELIEKRDDKVKEPIKQQIFGVELSLGDADLNGIIETGKVLPDEIFVPKLEDLLMES